MTYVVGWLIALIVFVVIEAVTAGVVSIWFAGGAAVSLLFAAIGFSLPSQVIIFFVISILLLTLLRPMSKTWIAPKTEPTNIDRNIGVEALVTEEINHLKNTGAIQLGGLEWSARSVDNTIIPEGSLIRTERIEGVHLYVSLVEAAPDFLSGANARKAFWR